MSDLLPVGVENEIKALVADCETPKELIQKMINMPQVDCPVSHTFVNGNYIRELLIASHTYWHGFDP